MPLKGEARTKYMRDYMRRKRAAERTGSPKRADATTKPAGPDHAAKARIAELEKAGAGAAAEIAALKAELASERNRREAAEAKHAKPGVDDEDQSSEAAAAGPMGKRVFKLVLRLDSPNDNEVLLAARKLIGELKGNGSDLRVLANALEAEWEKQQKAKPAPPPSIDFSKVEAAVTRYAADRTTVKFNTMWKAVIAEVPALDSWVAVRGGDVIRYVHGCLHRLGFTGSSSGRTWSR